MQLENIKFGLMLASGAVFLILIFFATYYTLYEISLNKALTGRMKLKWSVLALLVPGVGAFSYFLLAEKPWFSEKAGK